MKFVRLIVLFTCCVLSTLVSAQETLLDQKITIQFNDLTVAEALDMLMEETRGSINYRPSSVPKNRKISAHYEQMEISEIIKRIWGDQPISIRAKGNVILLKAITIDRGKGTLNASILDEKGNPLPGVTARLLGTSFGDVTGLNGETTLNNIPVGTYSLEISYLGYEKTVSQAKINKDQVTTVSKQLQRSTEVLGEIVVEGQSEAMLKSVQPIQVTVLEAQELNAQPLGAQDLIKRSAGVQLREQGGLGSAVSVNLNGLSGQAVRIFYDGVPIEFLGGGIGLNALPIGLIDRIDIYKGVAPVEVSADALGGVINIIPKRAFGDYLEASYQVGSFNTHRANLIGRREINPKLVLGFNGFYNYSANNYKLRNILNASFEVFRNNFGRLDTVLVENTIDARRFHDTHQSFSLEGQAEIYDTKWADRLSVVVGYTDRMDEVQHGIRLARRPFGEAESFANQWTSLINYSKKIGDHWEITQKSSFSHTRTFVDDSTSNTYDWNGNLLPFVNQDGAEIGNPTNRRGTDIGTSHRSTVKYSFNENHHLVASNFFGYNEVSGKDPYGIRVTIGNSTIDPNRVSSSLGRNIFGLQYGATWLKGDQITSTVFYKHYHLNGETVNFTFTGGAIGDNLSVVSIKRSYHGGGAAIKYNFNKRFFIRTSYERTIRIPSITEFFGNFATVAQNQDLQPERGHNGNLGINFKTNENENFGLNVELNTFVRDQQDRIRLDAPSPAFSQYVNDQRVLSRGAELSTKVWPVKNLKFDLNFTYQRITLADSDGSDDSTIGFDLQNIPNLFFNTSASYTIPGLLSKDDRVNFFWNYFFVDRFSIALVKDLDTANSENIVPVQHDHAVGLSYSDIDKGLTFSASLNNVFDRTLFDNFKAPKPSRNIMFKILYKLNHKI